MKKHLFAHVAFFAFLTFYLNTPNSYLYEDWSIGTITLLNMDKIKSLPIRYDLKYNGLEIKADGKVKFLEGPRISEFSFATGTWEFKTFVNPTSLVKINPDIQYVFLEVLESGKWSLYRQAYVKLIKGNYNAALDMGEPTNKIVQKYNFILSNGDKAFVIESFRKKFAENFENSEDVLVFFKQNRINLKLEEDIFHVLRFLNVE